MDDCLFCKIVAKEIPSKMIYEDDEIFAFYDIAPKAPVHFLVIPKKHFTHLMEIEEGDSALMGKLLFHGQRLAKELGLEESGARFVLNCKEEAGQTVWHIHLHILGGRPLSWPPG
ncbi:MAG: histidine triad nucleotide-binding protein [Fibrobacter sp.]|jgi:histidine triad (HIT) family protein|nr:histidine triad nucleotide-binding protein [Fibrobacter sp.]